jgi:hypothetical protein
MIDPATGLDPESGMVGLKETHQPTGAIGAVMSYLNADKSRQISEALQQHRAASAQMEQQQADEFASRQARDDQIRQALSQLGPNATADETVNTALHSGMDIERALPWLRARESAGSRMGAAEIKARGDRWHVAVQNGMSPDEADRRYSGTSNPDDLDLIHAVHGEAPGAAPSKPAGMPFLAPQQGPEAPPPPPEGSQPLPVPAAKAAAGQGIATRNQAQAASITAKTPAEVDALKALASMRRMKDQIKAVTGKPSDSQLLQWQHALTAKEDYLRKLTFDKYGDEFEETPAREDAIKKAKAEAEEIRAIIKSKQNATPGGASSSSPGVSPFAPGTFDTTTPGGSTTAAGGTSSPKTVSKTIVLPSL